MITTLEETVPPKTTGPCFEAETLIKLATNELIPISRLRIGDRLLAFDEITATTTTTVVTFIETHIVSSIHILNGSIHVTSSHPMVTSRGRVVVSDLLIGDEMLGANGNRIKLESIDEISDAVSVFNIQVGPIRNFFAGGVLVGVKPRESDL